MEVIKEANHKREVIAMLLMCLVMSLVSVINNHPSMFLTFNFMFPMMFISVLMTYEGRLIKEEVKA